DYLKTALRHTQFNGFDTDRNLAVLAQRKRPLLAQSRLLKLFEYNLALSRLFDARSGYPSFAENIVERSIHDVKCLNPL
ncbi:MAG: hypothetical protein ACTINL_01635, partial [Serratia proteamaculans]